MAISKQGLHTRAYCQYHMLVYVIQLLNLQRARCKLAGQLTAFEHGDESSVSI